MATNMPINKFKAGNIEVAIWSNKREVNGATVEYKTASLSRSYMKKGEDVWRNDVINNLRRNDLQKAIIVLQKAQEALLLTEKDEDD